MIRSAKDYHQLTSYDRARMSGHFLDWPNQPNVFKTYTGMPTVALPEPASRPDVKLSELLLEKPADGPETLIDPAELSRLLYLTHAITAKTRHGGMDFYFRSIASAGALYPFELYVATNGVKDLEDGLYHHTLGLNALTLLRSGNVLTELSDAIPMQSETSPSLVFFLTAIFFRSSWKYRDRAFRYHLLDTGHMVENLAVALRESQLPYKVHYDFDDDRINGVLCLDISREVCLAAVPVWAAQDAAGSGVAALEVPSYDLAAESIVARNETDYPAIRDIHALSKDAKAPHESAPSMLDSLGIQMGDPRQIPEPTGPVELLPYAEAVFTRRSMRNFVNVELNEASFSTLLNMLCSTVLADAQAEAASQNAIVVGLLANNISGFDPGFYVLDAERKAVRQVFTGNMADHMAHVCLDQAWLENCAVHFLFLSNLEMLERTYGARGYRHAMLTAGRLGQRLYVGATAMRLGCCGIGAFYDREAAGTLTLNEQSALLYLVGAGPIRKWYSR
jgi:SagB-type dehydrogenase family enzyme